MKQNKSLDMKSKACLRILSVFCLCPMGMIAGGCTPILLLRNFRDLAPTKVHILFGLFSFLLTVVPLSLIFLAVKLQKRFSFSFACFLCGISLGALYMFLGGLDSEWRFVYR